MLARNVHRYELIHVNLSRIEISSFVRRSYQRSLGTGTPLNLIKYLSSSSARNSQLERSKFELRVIVQVANCIDSHHLSIRTKRTKGLVKFSNDSTPSRLYFFISIQRCARTMCPGHLLFIRRAEQRRKNTANV